MAENDQQSPWTRPGWIISAVICGVLLVMGIVLTVTFLTRDDDTPAPTGQPGTPTPGVPAPPADPDAESICGLSGVELDGDLPDAPDAEWAYVGTAAYPTSAEYGPGLNEGEMRTCYQHTPTGALFMVANLAVGPSDLNAATEWFDYAVSPGPFKDDLLAANEQAAPETPDPSGTRFAIRGFRLLDYSGQTARVDLGVAYTVSGQETYMSMVYELVWHEGDWRLSGETATAFDAAQIPNLNGYTPWGA
ncbi:hypothetical protein [Litorihabitans aurantiacus]|uniref:DUF8175 domain-containing protein n=1 Tax=Litorihabitans aurantiacus TaxID=1930061 RepID=A0AA37XIN7_9MICO|nr:hypothetical protein [Litorihabitans aurantiacus]GMA33656.1 hypothetical protein GCM10025875_36480 [Litorihabitans aurantiacus]GMA33724.1 hypothetical protein GCM10025875_37160 [Litorihabitans aurantiacus]